MRGWRLRDDKRETRRKGKKAKLGRERGKMTSLLLMMITSRFVGLELDEPHRVCTRLSIHQLYETELWKSVL